MDYTKYVLKSKEELEGLLAGKDNFFVVACNKCFKEFNTTEEPECGEFTALAEAQGKHITGSVKLDFLWQQGADGEASWLASFPRGRRMWWWFPAAWACRRWQRWNRCLSSPRPILSIMQLTMAWP